MEEQLSLIYRRFALLEQQVRVLLERVGAPCLTFASDVATTGHGGVPAEVVALARAGNAIAAIKLYRELTGAGLRDVVDSL
jgi:large subunit ribosomal protein L7/L12